MPVEEWRRVFDVNVTGPFCDDPGVRAPLRRRGAERRAASSTSRPGSVQSPRPAGGAYSALEGGARDLTKVAAMELGPHGIRVNVVSPGYIDVRG